MQYLKDLISSITGATGEQNFQEFFRPKSDETSLFKDFLERSISRGSNLRAVTVSSNNYGIERTLVVKGVTFLLSTAVSIGVSYFVLRILTNLLDPTKKEKVEAQKRAEQLLKKIGVKNAKLSELELCIAADLVCPTDIAVSWACIGGLETIISEIQETVILPFTCKHLFKNSSLLSAPKGVLLYGPPGCGKTMIAKATAKASGVNFINLQVSSMLDKWYGESQKRVAAIFSLAKKIQPVILFIDEIDSFLRSRSDNDHEATVMMKTQFMTFWDGLGTDQDSQILIMGATNRPDAVDSAILRRMPSKFHIPLPNADQREAILRVTLDDEPVSDDLDYADIASKAAGCSGSDLKELCRMAALRPVREYIQTKVNKDHPQSSDPVQMRLMDTPDFVHALHKLRTTEETQNASFLSRDQSSSSQHKALGEWFLSMASAVKLAQESEKNKKEDNDDGDVSDVADGVIDDITPE